MKRREHRLPARVRIRRLPAGRAPATAFAPRWRRVSLTAKAFDTLVYLVEHEGIVLHKDELMRALWPDTAVEENNLNQNISILRRALGEHRGDHRYIATVPGRGYQFVAKVRIADESPGQARTDRRRIDGGAAIRECQR